MFGPCWHLSCIDGCFDNAMKIGKPVFKAMAQGTPACISADYSLAGRLVAQGKARNPSPDINATARLAHPLSRCASPCGLECP